MTDISATGGTLNGLSIREKTQPASADNQLGQSAFLELMITQLENQDPLSPQDNGDFIAQLAQFSSVEGIDRLNNSFDSFSAHFLSNQALQASSLVGRSVTVASETAILEAHGIVSGSFALPASTTQMRVDVYSEAGELLQTMPLGFQTAGEKLMRWDGLNLEINGEIVDWTAAIAEADLPAALPPGKYRFEVNAAIDGENTRLDTALSANVNSVTLAADGGISLNLAGLGTVSLDDVKQFN
ncbi:flagellar hook assembly protein FlgD [Exilibacterium tricleocarpae]|uniref:Basal-body rod modification protein FlgD n=1 Tax=Exilibacterium tricleocarpae TaxID=2591008 RepID=A0A545U3S6_9GAMM|nr:flagellar hook assembly protein FlgD [Exilibacterium tricleocarpae]TQV84132.1 flagellar hook assembly protein FlgD [Exilibacterium tricleocarpae]